MNGGWLGGGDEEGVAGVVDLRHRHYVRVYFLCGWSGCGGIVGVVVGGIVGVVLLEMLWLSCWSACG